MTSPIFMSDAVRLPLPFNCGLLHCPTFKLYTMLNELWNINELQECLLSDLEKTLLK
jgi:hypothetical protein